MEIFMECGVILINKPLEFGTEETRQTNERICEPRKRRDEWKSDVHSHGPWHVNGSDLNWITFLDRMTDPPPPHACRMSSVMINNIWGDIYCKPACKEHWYWRLVAQNLKWMNEPKLTCNQQQAACSQKKIANFGLGVPLAFKRSSLCYKKSRPKKVLLFCKVLVYWTWLSLCNQTWRGKLHPRGQVLCGVISKISPSSFEKNEEEKERFQLAVSKI